MSRFLYSNIELKHQNIFFLYDLSEMSIWHVLSKQLSILHFFRQFISLLVYEMSIIKFAMNSSDICKPRPKGNTLFINKFKMLVTFKFLQKVV